MMVLALTRVADSSDSRKGINYLIVLSSAKGASAFTSLDCPCRYSESELCRSPEKTDTAGNFRLRWNFPPDYPEASRLVWLYSHWVSQMPAFSASCRLLAFGFCPAGSAGRDDKAELWQSFMKSNLLKADRKVACLRLQCFLRFLCISPTVRIKLFSAYLWGWKWD